MMGWILELHDPILLFLSSLTSRGNRLICPTVYIDDSKNIYLISLFGYLFFSSENLEENAKRAMTDKM